MYLRDDDEVTVHRPGRDDVVMPWGQWRENRVRYEGAGFTVTLPEPKEINPSSPAKIVKSTQGACLDEDDPADWDDLTLIHEIAEIYSDPADFEDLPTDMNGFDYRTWAKEFVRNIQSQFVLSAKQRESALRLYRRAKA